MNERFCKYCQCEVLENRQYCIEENNPSAFCQAERIYIGFKFVNLADDKRHNFYRALRDAHIPAFEIGDRVVAETGDIVMVEEIFRRTVDHRGGQVFGDCIRMTDDEVADMERELTNAAD